MLWVRIREPLCQPFINQVWFSFLNSKLHTQNRRKRLSNFHQWHGSKAAFFTEYTALKPLLPCLQCSLLSEGSNICKYLKCNLISVQIPRHKNVLFQQASAWHCQVFNIVCITLIKWSTFCKYPTMHCIICMHEFINLHSQDTSVCRSLCMVRSGGYQFLVGMCHSDFQKYGLQNRSFWLEARVLEQFFFLLKFVS